MKITEADTTPTMGWSAGVLSVFALAVLALVAGVSAQVAASAAGLNPLVSFERAWPLVGRAVTLNTLLDLQWHLLALVALGPAGLVLWADGHVRVDVFYRRLSQRRRAVVDLVGNVVFAAPFLLMATPAAWRFAVRAWSSDEGSAGGGMTDLWLVKALLPLGLALLALAVAAESVRLIRRLAQ